MAQLQLKRISATSSHVYVQSNADVYIANVVTPNNPVEEASRYNFILRAAGETLPLSPNNLRPSSEFTHQSSVFTSQISATTQTKLEEYLPWQTKFIAITQVNDTIASVTNLTGAKVIPANKYVQRRNQSNFPYDRQFMSTRITESTGCTDVARFYPFKTAYYRLATDNYYQLPNEPEQIGRVSKYRIFTSTATRLIRTQMIHPEYAFQGINFNYLTETLGNSDEYSPSYARALNYANSTTCKNEYTDVWSRPLSFEHAPSSNPAIAKEYITSAEAERVRQYLNCGIADGVVWMSYVNNLRYARSHTPLRYLVSPSGKKYRLSGGGLYDISEGTLFVDLNARAGYDLITKTRNLDVDCQSIDLLRAADMTDRDHLEYQYVERVKGSNRFQNLPKHKSNLFSIEIRNSGILTNADIASRRDMVQTSINNIIRSVITKIAPIHTQLINIYWSGT